MLYSDLRALSIVTVSLKRAGIPLYLDKEGDGDNFVNRILWNLMIAIPLAAALASCIGYLATAQRCWRVWKPRSASGSSCW